MVAKHFLSNARNQAFITATVLVTLSLVLVQLFFLGEELEGTRSRAAKLSIAEIIAKQQIQHRVEQGDYARGESKFDRASGLRAGNTILTNSQVDNSKKDIVAELQHLGGLIELQGIIKNGNMSIALIKIPGLDEIQSMSIGGSFGNGVTISEIDFESIVLRKRDVGYRLGISNTTVGVTDASVLYLPVAQ